MYFLYLFKPVKPVNPKGNQPWIFIRRTDAEAETTILWPPDVKNWLIWKDPHAGKDWRQEEKGMTEDEMVGWHHRLNWHEFEQALAEGEGQGKLACSVTKSQIWLSNRTTIIQWWDWDKYLVHKIPGDSSPMFNINDCWWISIKKFCLII